MSLPAENLTAREVAEFLGVSSETLLRRWRPGDRTDDPIANRILDFLDAAVDDPDRGSRGRRSAMWGILLLAEDVQPRAGRLHARWLPRGDRFSHSGETAALIQVFVLVGIS